jgi:hypothetical protein
MLCVKAFGVWLVLLVVAFMNGGIRETFIVPRVGEQIGHVISVVVFSGVIYVMHEPWSKLLADYNIFRGRLFIIVWLTTLFSPLVCGKLLQS